MAPAEAPYATGLRLTKILIVVPTDGSAVVAIPDFEWPLIDEVSESAAGVIVSGCVPCSALLAAIPMEPIATLSHWGGRRSTMKWTLFAAGIYTVILLTMAERQASAGIELLTKSIMRGDDYTLLKRASLQSP